MISEEEYYDILLENIADVSELPTQATPEQIERVVGSFNPHMELIGHPLNDTHFYRARYYDVGKLFDITDPNQFGYIHNAHIAMFRYNRENEAVLYTATDPAIAYREIYNPKNKPTYFLSIWKKKVPGLVFGAFIITNNTQAGSNADKYHMFMVERYDSYKLQYYHALGYLLENPDGNYELSSQISHRLFENGAGMLVSTSMKSDGKELNFTFRQDIADNCLEIDTIYECCLPPSGNPAVPLIKRVGDHVSNSIEWHEWEVVPESVVISNPQPKGGYVSLPYDVIRCPKYIKQLRPNPHWTITERHTGYMTIKGKTVFVKFRIRLK